MAIVSSVGAESYRLPPQEVTDVIDAEPTPSVDFSPNGEWMLVVETTSMPDIEDVSRRMLRLAGLRIDPVANSRFQTRFDKGLQLRRRDSEEMVRIPLPTGSKLSNYQWSHNSEDFWFTTVTADGTQLWGANVSDPANPKQLVEKLSVVLQSCIWMPNGRQLLCSVVPSDRGEEPAADQAPIGPNVQETAGNKSPTRTYQDLLKNPYDEALLEYYAVSQLALVSMDGTVSYIGEPALFDMADPSPNGELLLVSRIQRPYSYLQTIGSFPRLVEVWDLQGNVVHKVADIPMAENIPIEGVRTGPRQMLWQAGADATLLWTEALDGGDPRVEAEMRDQWWTHSAPFDSPPQPLVKIKHRAVSLAFMEDPQKLVTYEYDRDRRWLRILLHDFSQPQQEPKVLTDRSIRDRYGDPGRFLMPRNETGNRVVLQSGDWVYRVSTGATPQGNLPFISRQNLNTLETETIWRCEAGHYERPIMMLDADEPAKFVTQHQTPTTPPNYFYRSANATESQPITRFPDPTPQIRGIKKQLVKYQRADGVDLSATLYLPADYQEGQRLPLMIWAYPIEFNDASTAGQITSSPSRFTRILGSSHLALLMRGYAVMDGATMPIIGDPETMNDTFIDQLVGAAQAAIDKAVDMGVADRHRVAVGGHSYGAFMTANLLAHCDLFQAGIARSGAYNRTLTPFGFQSERRTLWEAGDVYFAISPFMHAEKIQEPLLLIHGEEDNNSGTFPMQSKRLFQAIKGNGGTARLVMLPEESHGYRARESVLHVQAEMLDWLDKHVKNASPPSTSGGSGGATTSQ